MKIMRSTKCSLKYSTQSKLIELEFILKEYGKVVNIFIDYFWGNGIIEKKELLKPIVDIPQNTWLSARLRKVAAREALDMVKSTQEVIASNKEQIQLSINSINSKIDEIKERDDTRENRRKINRLYCKRKRLWHKLIMMQPTKPKHTGKRMCVSSTIAILNKPKNSKFDSWLHIFSVGKKISLDLPIKFHKHYHQLHGKGKRLNSYIITKNYVQFCFEIDTGKKKDVKTLGGIDTGINALASLSNGEQFGTDIKQYIDKIKRCEQGSNGQKRARNSLKQKINEVARDVVNKFDLIVVEKLKNMNNNSKLKERLSKNIRSSIGIWNYGYWLMRLEQKCEINRVCFRTVSPYYTSQRCFKCGHTDRENRFGEIFQCQACDHTGNADINAACNILERFSTGKYGSCYKPLIKTYY